MSFLRRQESINQKLKKIDSREKGNEKHKS